MSQEKPIKTATQRRFSPSVSVPRTQRECGILYKEAQTPDAERTMSVCRTGNDIWAPAQSRIEASGETARRAVVGRLFASPASRSGNERGSSARTPIRTIGSLLLPIGETRMFKDRDLCVVGRRDSFANPPNREFPDAHPPLHHCASLRMIQRSVGNTDNRQVCAQSSGVVSYRRRDKDVTVPLIFSRARASISPICLCRGEPVVRLRATRACVLLSRA